MQLHRYLLSSLLLESEIDLPSAALARAPEPAKPAADVVRLRAGSIDCSGVDAWELRTSGLSFARLDAWHLARFADEVVFAIDARGAEVTCDVTGSAPPALVEQLFLDQVLPLVLHARGGFVFHASAVLAGGVVGAFLGQSGRGKSTLAASLATAPESALFADDGLAVTIEGDLCRAHPSYASVRLWPRSAEALFGDARGLPLVSPRADKRRVALAGADTAARFARAYLIEPPAAEVSIRPVRPAAALLGLASHLFRLDLDDRTALTRELSFLEALVARVSVRALAYPRDFGALPQVRDAILRDLTSRE